MSATGLYMECERRNLRSSRVPLSGTLSSSGIHRQVCHLTLIGADEPKARFSPRATGSRRLGSAERKTVSDVVVGWR